jgi:hypothetical protein
MPTVALTGNQPAQDFGKSAARCAASHYGQGSEAAKFGSAGGHEAWPGF